MGNITVDLKRNGLDGVQGEVTLPPGVTGTFVWGGRDIRLRGGVQMIRS